MRTTARRLALAASAVLALAASGGVALAQMPPPPPPAPPMPPPPPMPPMEPMMKGEGGMAMMHHELHGDPAAHAQHLRDVLQLRPDQDAALKTYLAATDPKAMMESMKPDGMGGPMKEAMTTPERLDRQAAHMAQMAAAFQTRAAATKTFYAALTPSQRKAFDALAPEMGGPRMMMMMRSGKPGHGEMPMGMHKEQRTVIMKHKAG